jgi:hypothetical protein
VNGRPSAEDGGTQRRETTLDAAAGMQRMVLPCHDHVGAQRAAVRGVAPGGRQSTSQTRPVDRS